MTPADEYKAIIAELAVGLDRDAIDARMRYGQRSLLYRMRTAPPPEYRGSLLDGLLASRLDTES